MTRLVTTPAILGILVGGMLAAGLAAGCGSNQVAIGSQDVDAAAGRGGAVAGGSGGSATGGVVGAGGATSSGGTTGVGSGGSGGTGGSKVNGGTTASGGSKAGGGIITTGGATGTGGGGSGGTTTTCAGRSESCVTRSCCAPLVCGNTTDSPICLESYPPPADSGTGTGGAGGSTGKTCGGLAGVSCATGEFCDLQAGSCNVSDATGTCVVRKMSGACPLLFVAQPVCGCDGTTYDSDCERQVAGVSKKSDGACPTGSGGAGGGAGGTGGAPKTGGAGGSTGTGGTGGSTGKTCGGLAGATCATNEFCDLQAGSCNVSDATGTCVVKKMPCPLLLVAQPVCGCDGTTYDSDCERQAAGISKQADGACPTADAGVIMTATLPAPCQVDGDCCVAMDTCMAVAYLVGLTEYPAMVASIPSIGSRTGTCLPCLQPAVQVQCKGGFCAGEKLPFSSSTGALTTSHCGYVSVSDAGTSTASAHAAVDAGTAAGPSTWGCGP